MISIGRSNMNVIEIKPNGFCNGVKRAIEIVDKAINDPNTPRPIYMLGYLVHNKISSAGFVF